MSKIITIDLAEEYRLTEGRKTPYGLRRRTMKGWDIVKREWQKIVKPSTAFSEETKKKLQDKLDELRGGEKREQIGSHKLYSALISDEAAWAIWREPTQEFQSRADKNNWAADPLEAFREYYETCEQFEEITQRPLRFTPADAKFSRRLFMFTDACSFGTDGGEYKHDLKNLAVTVPVAIRGTDGRFSMTSCRLAYSAPRLLRDRIRESDGTYEQDWAQPMVRALLGKDGSAGDEKINPQELKEAAVALMPDFDAKGKRRFLLNFPLELDEEKIKAKIGKAVTWEKQFASWKKGAQLPYLLWEGEFGDKAPQPWWEKVSSYRVLAADLGTRHTASIALLECGKEKKDEACRFIGNACGSDWYARFVAGNVLRLPGENAQVLRLRTKLDTDDTAGKVFREELSGERGRTANLDECAETLAMLSALQQERLLDSAATEEALQRQFSFPEQNDKLLVAVRWAQRWLASCVSWLWKLEKPEDAKDGGASKQRESTLTEISEQPRKPDWAALAKTADDKDALHKLAALLNAEITHQRVLVEKQLLRLTHRILPLRGRNWEWVEHPDKKDDCHLLQQTAAGTGPDKVPLAGQRGLSIARIEQVSELRRRWQSLNQSLRVKPGERPPTASEMRNASIPDPCPDILEKLENIREQRVDQTAHLILAKALGLKLKMPQMSADQRRATDTHGEYEVVAPPVDFIVLEDLTRYLPDQGRAKRENSRLMKWCHRAITAKLKMLAEPFGIPVLETQAAYTSRFCALTATAGFRAVEVGLKNKGDYRWRSLLEAEAKAAQENKPLTEERKQEIAHAKKIFSQLEQMEKDGRKNPTLLAPQPGGSIFVTAVPANNPLNRKSLAPLQADINAATNIALRAIAHPGCADIHHRVRTERKKDTVFTREARRFGKEQSKIIMCGSDSMPKEKNSNLFYDTANVTAWGRARLETDGAENQFPYASGPALWKTVNDWEFQWARCEAINADRIKKQ